MILSNRLRLILTSASVVFEFNPFFDTGLLHFVTNIMDVVAEL
jgi:hypothetical protein